MVAWHIVEKYDNMNFIPSTQAFKCKCYPGGLIKNFKDQLCARGNQQLELINFSDTYSPVVQQTTVLLMITLQILIGLKSKHVGVTASFLRSNIVYGENVYVYLPKGFYKYSKTGRKKCLKLKKKFNGLRQSPRAFWKYLIKKLEAWGLQQQEFYMCLFVRENFLCILYVDGIILWERDDDDINFLAMELQELGVDL